MELIPRRWLRRRQYRQPQPEEGAVPAVPVYRSGAGGVITRKISYDKLQCEDVFGKSQPDDKACARAMSGTQLRQLCDLTLQ